MPYAIYHLKCSYILLVGLCQCAISVSMKGNYWRIFEEESGLLCVLCTLHCCLWINPGKNILQGQQQLIILKRDKFA